MGIKINIPEFLQPIANEVVVAEVNGSTVGDCLGDLIKRFPLLETKLFRKNGVLYDYIDIFINGESAYPDEMAKQVAEGDKLYIIYIIPGG
ncbi:MoaD/ThiS family protein [Chloroflexota bacterium]